MKVTKIQTWQSKDAPEQQLDVTLTGQTEVELRDLRKALENDMEVVVLVRVEEKATVKP